MVLEGRAHLAHLDLVLPKTDYWLLGFVLLKKVGINQLLGNRFTFGPGSPLFPFSPYKHTQHVREG